VFWTLFRDGSLLSLPNTGCFLAVEGHRGSRKRGHILVFEGRNGEGLRTFEAELRWVVNFFQPFFAASSLLCVGKSPLPMLTSQAKGGRGRL
jgi:hypothetical protein